MPIVSNTSPILSLAVIDRLDLLRQQFTELFIPPVVQQELNPESDLPGAGTIQQALQDGWIRVVALQDTKMAQALTLELDQGEAAAIALALELELRDILMDEREGRTRAKTLGLQPVGVLGVLLRAKQQGAIASLKVEMQALRSKVGFFIAAPLYEQLLKAAGEQ